VTSRSALQRADWLSEHDRELIALLQVDGRRSFAEIARAIGITEKAVARRVAELVERGVIQIVPVGDHRVLGYRTVAMLAIVARGRPVGQVAADIAAIDAVDYLNVSAGRYDIFANVCCVDRSDLMTVVDDEVRAIDGVHAVEVFPYLRLHYQEGAFRVPEVTDRPAPLVRDAAIDDIDRAIIGALSPDGRVPMQQVADAIGASEALVRRRLKRLQERNVIRVMAIVNPMSLGFDAIARFAITVAPGHDVSDVADALAATETISYIIVCAGRYDILAEAVCVDSDELADVLDDVRRIPGVARCETLLYLDLHYKPIEPATARDAG
jgi:Lrp/AsnC family transcriptional regulator for asnA, asnC and gidA